MTKGEVFQGAFSLTDDDRAELVEELLHSLPTKPEYSDAWKKELKQRLASVKNGSAQFGDWDGFRTRMKEKYGVEF
jgi:putative addiction module component (TIGR02574 family)